MRIKNPFVFPTTNRGAKRLEYGIVAAGIAVAILAALHAVNAKQRCAGGESTFDKVPRALMQALVETTTK